MNGVKRVIYKECQREEKGLQKKKQKGEKNRQSHQMPFFKIKKKMKWREEEREKKRRGQ